jgi:ApbE superfamily uncharacterized protein (UPF0280 family)
VSAVRARLSDGRWHFQHGPIDCIVCAEGNAGAVADGVERAWRRFRGVLDELVAELPLLRVDLASPAGAAVAPVGPVARRMVAACRAHARDGRFFTAMAAVAGSVAEELIGAFAAPGIRRAYVNNGGDIALHLAPGASFEIGLFADPAHGLAGLPLDGRFAIDAGSPVRGIATSGWRGRSFSLGIADAVTVLATSASRADAAATVIANAVDVDDPRIVRRPASAVRDDSDLGDRLVTCAVPRLPAALVGQALDRGRVAAGLEIAAGRIVAALLCLQGRAEACGVPHRVLETCP